CKVNGDKNFRERCESFRSTSGQGPAFGRLCGRRLQMPHIVIHLVSMPFLRSTHSVKGIFNMLSKSYSIFSFFSDQVMCRSSSKMVQCLQGVRGKDLS